jgi:FkbM family methyltransferase
MAVSALGHPLGLIKRLGQQCHGVIHVGANIGQEFDSYCRAGLASVVYIEPIPELFAKLKQRVSLAAGHHAVQALCTESEGEEVAFYVASNNGESSSIFPFGSHADRHPHVTYQATLRLRTTTLDRIVFETPGIRHDLLDCLVIDVQGAEAKVLAGGTRTLQLCRFVFVEISEGGLYRGDAPFQEIILMLTRAGFLLKSLDLNRHGWGNAFFVKGTTAASSWTTTPW